MLPSAPTATLLGAFSSAAVAEPPSPEKPPLGTPPVGEMLLLPATVVMVPLDTFLTRELPVSAIYKLPVGSMAMPAGLKSLAFAAGPPSPDKPATKSQLPATTVSCWLESLYT